MLVVACAAIYKLELTYDLAFFLPQPNNDAQKVLVERLGEGPATQLIFLVLPGTSAESARQLAEQLRTSSYIQQVLPESAEFNLDNFPDVLWRNRLLLVNLPSTESEWLQILETRMSDLMFAHDENAINFIAADPALMSIRALDGLQSKAQQTSFSHQQDQYLLLHTKVPAFDIESQVRMLADLRSQVDAAGYDAAQYYGAGVYGVDLQKKIKRESMFFSLLASIGLILLIALRFRSVATVIAVIVPLAAGGVAGLCVLAFVFAKVHGITLAFGFTLLGIVLDYPLHLFSHHDVMRKKGVSAIQLKQHVWPTLLLGVASTLFAYGAFMLSGTQGLVQLGVFSAVGIFVGALTAAWLARALGQDDVDLFKTILMNRQRISDARSKLRHWPWLLVLICSLPILLTRPVFNDDLSALTPIPKATLDEEEKLRQRMGVGDVRYLVSLRDSNLEALLVDAESVGAKLDSLIKSNEIKAYKSIAQILPSRTKQQMRREKIEKQKSKDIFQNAVTQSQFTEEAFKPFLNAVRREVNREDWLTIEDIQADSKINDVAQNLIYRSDDQWVSLIYLHGIQSPERLSKILDVFANAKLVDLKNASLQMVKSYRDNVTRVLAAALIVIALFLWFWMRDLKLVVWLIGSLLAAVAVSILVNVLMQNGLSLFELVALALVAGLGLDYGLFYSRVNAKTNQAMAIQHAVLLCAISSALVFGILSFSSIPLLKGIGLTVTVGVIAAYVLARYGRYENAAI